MSPRPNVAEQWGDQGAEVYRKKLYTRGARLSGPTGPMQLENYLHSEVDPDDTEQALLRREAGGEEVEEVEEDLTVGPRPIEEIDRRIDELLANGSESEDDK